MKLIRSILAWVRGDPRVIENGSRAVLKAAHPRPSSGREVKHGIYLLWLVGTLWMLIDHYGPETAHDPNKNLIIELSEYGLVSLINAGERLVAFVQAKSLDVPDLRGWMYVTIFTLAMCVFLNSFLFRLYCWLTNREEVRITVGPETLTVRRYWWSFGKTIVRSAIREVRVIANHPTGHDVVILHDDGILRLASIFGDETRALLFKLRLDDLLAREKLEKTLDPAARKPVTAQEQGRLIY